MTVPLQLLTMNVLKSYSFQQSISDQSGTKSVHFYATSR